jgi:uncharacterized protein (TIGR02598 family)
MKSLNSLTDSALAKRERNRMVAEVTPPAMHLPKTARSKSRLTQAAFTLVEVVLSIGVVSFALVSMVGLLPVGMATQRQATSNMVESQIVQGLANEIQLTDFDNLQTQTITYYDREGKSVLASDVNRLYDVTVTLNPVDDLKNCPVNLKTSKNEAWNVAITVQNRTRPNETGKYSVIVARTTL